jgi:adenylate kinase
MINIVLLGPPGAGKGTQAQMLASELNLMHLSTGDMLRQEIGLSTELGLLAKTYMDEGKLVPDQLVVDIVKKRINEYIDTSGFVFDGFPRNITQAKVLNDLFVMKGYKNPYVINIQVDDKVIIDRLSGRLYCSQCGSVYHIKYALPRIDELCDNCGIKLSQRDDDNANIVRDRLNVYKNETHSLLEYYEMLGNLFNVDGVGDVSDVFGKIMETLVDYIEKQ